MREPGKPRAVVAGAPLHPPLASQSMCTQPALQGLLGRNPAMAAR